LLSSFHSPECLLDVRHKQVCEVLSTRKQAWQTHISHREAFRRPTTPRRVRGSG
jgi:hypothetical protein